MDIKNKKALAIVKNDSVKNNGAMLFDAFQVTQVLNIVSIKVIRVMSLGMRIGFGRREQKKNCLTGVR